MPIHIRQIDSELTLIDFEEAFDGPLLDTLTDRLARRLGGRLELERRERAELEGDLGLSGGGVGFGPRGLP